MKYFVYLTVNKINGKCYIGSHHSDKENDNYFGSGILIKKALKKYRKKNFILVKLKNLEENDNPLLLEEYYIKKFDTLDPNGYNISPTGGLRVLGAHSNESKRKISIAHKGKKFSDIHKKNISLSNTGVSRNIFQHLSIETKLKISESQKGKDPWMKGKTHSEESRKKISVSRKANPIYKVNHTMEGLERISYAMKNRVISEETKEKMRKARIGKEPWNKNGSHTEETKQKMRKSKMGMYIGEKNPMFGKSPYDIWVLKYGKIEADRRKLEFYKNRNKKSYTIGKT